MTIVLDPDDDRFNENTLFGFFRFPTPYSLLPMYP